MDNKIDINRIIEMAWEDRTTFDSIKDQFGLKEQEVIKIMRRNMKRSSFRMWRERVLRMRFGVGMNTDHTLEEVGLQFSVTRERIRQIEAKALRKLKHPSRSKQLKS